MNSSMMEKKLETLSPKLQQEVIDFIDFLYDKYQKTNDAEYLENIPGFPESLREGKNERIEDCKSLKDINWE